MAKVDEIITLSQPVVEGLGFELWGVEYSAQGKHSTLRIYIEHENGIKVEDCSSVSHQLAAVYDVEDPITNAYTLEVSSPGMDRPLFTLAQYQRFEGHMVKIRLKFPFEGKRKYEGIIAGVEDEHIVLQHGEFEYLLPFEQIDKANIVPVFED
ncbi:ribosome maturation factor RimP [Salinispirillum marinum]|uniref:Ribosome maturation factor RimP n=2 Tax=Saccharospirillaceae TaxID=255527 RepID=A0ABV8BKA1_9GAMM